ncbi:glycosyl hydrolase family 8 [Novosphingobium sp. 9]|uniref:glycosyl hydrolase family 8 n=1 Tax=Novosphingobium sp. 9 TaxID=2025349 RepID=UPI000F851028|nr:glycosyl hydrolase family 8 [Novosphingobium sp. 9]AVQ10339.1 endoglucanase [Novosphingobium sp.]
MMNLNRRTFSIGMLLAMTAACNTGTQSHAEGRPFTGSLAGNWWPLYRQRFLAPEGRIVDNGNGGISHSEGQGYGMVLAALAGDRASFAKMADWADRTLLRKDMALYSWRYDPKLANPVSDPNNATDGDVLIAWALSIAAARWGNSAWRQRSAAVRADIRAKCVATRYGREILVPGIAGFVETNGITINPSYFIWSAMEAFAKLDGEAAWRGIINDADALLRLSRFGAHGVPTDWVLVTGRDQVAPAPDKPPRFGFDAIRVPLYATMAGRTGLTDNIAAYWRGCLAQGRPIPAWVDVMTGEEANYAVSEGGAAIVSRLLNTAAPSQLSNDYFAASLQMLAQARP